MFNGRDGDVLFKVGPGVPSFGNPALLAHIPGFPGIGVIFTQVAAGDTRLIGTSPDGRQASARAVRVRACGTSFNLAGFCLRRPAARAQRGRHRWQVRPRRRPGPQRRHRREPVRARGSRDLGEPRQNPGRHRGLPDRAPGRDGHGRRPDLAHQGLPGPVRPVLHRDPACPWPWPTRGVRVRAGVRAAAHGRAGRRPGARCTGPVASATPGWSTRPHGLCLRRHFSDGTTHRVVPVWVAGRAYIAIVAPPGCQLTSLSLFDASGHVIARTAASSPSRSRECRSRTASAGSS